MGSGRERRDLRPWSLRDRTLVAATCHGCGRLCDGSAFGRHLRNRRDRRAYVDRRCTNCKWGTRVKRSAPDA